MYIMKIEKVLQNKYLLYVLVFLATTQVIGHLMVKDDRSVALFLVFSLFASLFTKNMIVVLGSGILGTNLYNVIMASRRSQESMAGRRSVEGITVSIDDDGEGGEISLEIPPTEETTATTEETTATSEDIVDDDADDFEEDLDMVELEQGFEELEKEKTDDSGEDVNNALKNLEESLNKIGMEQIVKKSKNNVKKLENFTNRITDKYTNILGAYDFKEAYGSTGGARRKRK